MSLNPYAWVGGGVAALALIGGFYALDASKNHYKSLYQADEKTIIERNVTIENMTIAQNKQTDATEKTVTKVVQGPAQIKTVIQTIHDAPEPADCGTPELPHNVKDML